MGGEGGEEGEGRIRGGEMAKRREGGGGGQVGVATLFTASGVALNSN